MFARAACQPVRTIHNLGCLQQRYYLNVSSCGVFEAQPRRVQQDAFIHGGFDQISKKTARKNSRTFATADPVGVRQMTVHDLSALLSDPEEVAETQFIDVREQWEFTTSALPHFLLRPMTQLEIWGNSDGSDLDVEKRTVVLCHQGIRSQRVAQFLVGQGFHEVYSVDGGIDAYSKKVDRSVPLY